MALAGRAAFVRPQGVRALPVTVSRRNVVRVRATASDDEPKVVGKAVLVDILARENDMTREQASKAFETIFNGIQDAVAAGKRVTVLGFGSFERRERKERNGRNPATGEALLIPASKAPAFKPAPAFKDKVNGTAPPPKPKAAAPAPAAPKAAPPARPAPAPPAAKKVAPPKAKK